MKDVLVVPRGVPLRDNARDNACDSFVTGEHGTRRMADTVTEKMTGWGLYVTDRKSP